MEKVLGQRLSQKYMDTFHVCIRHPSVFTTLNVYPSYNRPSNIPIDDICSEEKSILLGMLYMDPEGRKTISDVDAMYRQSLREKYGYDDAPSHKLSCSPICFPFEIWESPERALQHNIAISDLCMAVHAKGFNRWTLHYAVFLFDSTLHVYPALFANIKILTYASLYVASLTEEEDDVSLSYFAKGAECADYEISMYVDKYICIPNGALCMLYNFTCSRSHQCFIYKLCSLALLNQLYKRYAFDTLLIAFNHISYAPDQLSTIENDIFKSLQKTLAAMSTNMYVAIMGCAEDITINKLFNHHCISNIYKRGRFTLNSGLKRAFGV
jgi:hypothetical protein